MMVEKPCSNLDEHSTDAQLHLHNYYNYVFMSICT